MEKDIKAQIAIPKGMTEEQRANVPKFRIRYVDPISDELAISIYNQSHEDSQIEAKRMSIAEVELRYPWFKPPVVEVDSIEDSKRKLHDIMNRQLKFTLPPAAGEVVVEADPAGRVVQVTVTAPAKP